MINGFMVFSNYIAYDEKDKRIITCKDYETVGMIEYNISKLDRKCFACGIDIPAGIEHGVWLSYNPDKKRLYREYVCDLDGPSCQC